MNQTDQSHTRNATVIVGMQFGDEGKGKLVDYLSEKYDIVVRYQGGANAGHTICFEDKTVVLHLIPSGIFHRNCTCVIGNGVVIDPDELLKEIETVRKLGYEVEDRLYISHNAHLIMPYHKFLDSASEESKGDQKIGTTGRGIGPSYMDKFARKGIRIVDLLRPNVLGEKLRANLAYKNSVITKIYEKEQLDVEQIVTHYTDFDRTIDQFVKNTQCYLNEQLRAGKSVLLEGAQGSLLDVDHGTYPFVTSSNPTSGGACTGSGIAPTHIGSVIGVCKAYMTRVGNGPFPTELKDETGAKLGKIGHEFGATTGRPRRCGWLDLVALKYSLAVNGVTELAITKLDVLDTFDEVKICTAYQLDGKSPKDFPTDVETLEAAKPVYKTFEGWKTSNVNAKSFEEMHPNAQKYLAYLEEELGVPIKCISVGPKRDQTIFR
ncbi:Adenylosuccinate synthase [Chloroherpeton thalassium ATCC 35110]|uniref:Adenylosuccinate synthetase n=1 Tax=Chloroherpeton thalassium (strain ATCC 35110 / GB-78) TaxID=517418 RepID=B3QS34_CHLT3|nr:adenylosuccinate synthase [Chloroherpeton thalassium]ACF13979.1 Adenylosuccinate synthase [Chloroherpeton thalassium ATCC 35110]